MSNKKEFIDLSPTSEEDIENNNFHESDLWMLKLEDGHILGPFDTHSLMQYSQTNEHLFGNVYANNLVDESWREFFTIAKFQRRKPKLVPIHSLMSSDHFMVLIDGQKTGPFSLNEMTQMVEEEKIALNTQISLDNGKSWIKLYQHHEFDRRLKKKSQDLPFVPEEEILNSSLELIQQKIHHSKETKEHAEEDALVGLAFIGHGNDKGQTLTKENTAHKTSSNIKINNTRLSSETRWFDTVTEKYNNRYAMAGVFALLIIFGALNSYNNTFNNSSDIKSASKEVKTDKKSINNNARTAKKAIKKNTQKSKIARARKYEPKKITRPAHTFRKPANTRRNRNVPTHGRTVFRESHVDERYEDFNNNDGEDFSYADDVARDIAAQEYNDDYEQLSDDQIEFIEQAHEEGFSQDSYDEMHDRDDQYEQITDFE